MIKVSVIYSYMNGSLSQENTIILEINSLKEIDDWLAIIKVPLKNLITIKVN